MSANNEDEGWMRSPEAAEYLGFAEQTIRKWVSQDRIPHHKIGRNVRFRRSELDEWVESGEAASQKAG